MGTFLKKVSPDSPKKLYEKVPLCMRTWSFSKSSADDKGSHCKGSPDSFSGQLRPFALLARAAPIAGPNSDIFGI